MAIKTQKNVVILCVQVGKMIFALRIPFAGALSEKLLKTKLYESDSDSANGSRMIYIRAKEDMFRFLGISQHRKKISPLSHRRRCKILFKTEHDYCYTHFKRK